MERAEPERELKTHYTIVNNLMEDVTRHLDRAKLSMLLRNTNYDQLAEAGN